MEINPISLGITEHDSWNPGQLDAILWARGGGTRILEAPLGSGKTAVAKAFGHRRRSVALCRTKFLQEQYGDGYAYDKLFGRNAYKCVHLDAGFFQTADECFHRGDMKECPYYDECEYVEARDAARESERAVLNYSIWFYMREKWPAIDALVCDEGQLLSDITLEHSSLIMTEKQRAAAKLPKWPFIVPGDKPTPRPDGTWSSNERKAREWLELAIPVAKNAATIASRRAKSLDEMRDAAQKERAVKELEFVFEALSVGQGEWFVRAVPNDSIQIAPLTAKHHFRRIFSPCSDRLIMSGTIGDPDTFADELGIEQFEFKSIPNQYPVDARTVWNLNAPKIGQSASQADYDKQADVIADAIKQLPGDWHTIILVTKKQDAKDLMLRLQRRNLANRVWRTDATSTREAVEQWEKRMTAVPGSIFVAHQLWEGYNGVREKAVIVAKVPYPYMGDPYELARQHHNGRFFLQRTANKLEQGLGRTRRSPADYDLNGRVNSFVAIADGNWVRVQKYLSQSLREAIRSR